MSEPGAPETRTDVDPEGSQMPDEGANAGGDLPSEEASAEDVAADASQTSTRHSGWRVLTNTTALGVGSILTTLGRLVVLGIMVRTCGMVVFAQYVLLIEILKLAEGVVDLGTTEVFVREVSQRPANRLRLLQILTATKLVQVPIGFVLLAVMLLTQPYSPDVVLAGLIGGVGLLAYGVILVYRVMFRAALAMQREIAAELISVLVMIGLILVYAREGVGIVTVFMCYVVSRMVFGGLCVFLGRNYYLPSLAGTSLADVRWALRSSAVIGAAGFLVVVYQVLDLLMLARLTDLGSDSPDVAYYSAAQKLAWPILIALAAVGGTLYSVVSSHWPHSRELFNRACQRGVDAVFLLGGLALCTLVAGARFYMGLLGPELVDGAPALRVLALLCLVKAFSMAVGPTLFVVKAQRQVLYCIAIALVAKFTVIAAVAPRMGYFGVALGALAVETVFVAVPTTYLVWKKTGFRVGFGVPLKVAAIVGVALAAVHSSLPVGGVMAAIVAPVLYIVLVFAFKVAKLSDIRLLLKKDR